MKEFNQYLKTGAPLVVQHLDEEGHHNSNDDNIKNHCKKRNATLTKE
jgi:hypothetical protein